jgi:MoaA/NifB/PqqE/SkfB family radical SAM enzyme
MFDPKKEQKRLTIDEFKKIGQFLDKSGCIGVVITGGEPFLRHDLPQIVKALNPKNKIISIVTNALIVNEKRLKDVYDAGANSIEFSLDSHNEEENDKSRNVKGHFKKVIEGIKLAKKIGLNVCLSPCLTHQNIRNFERFVLFAKSLNAFIFLSLAGDCGRWSDEENVVLDEKDWDLMQSYRRKYPFIRNDFSTNFILKEGCPAGREKLYISAYGDVIPCSFTQISFGNIRQEPLERIWERMRNFPPFKKYYPYCRRTRDRDYAKTYLDPIKNEREAPYLINKLLAKIGQKPLP